MSKRDRGWLTFLLQTLLCVCLSVTLLLIASFFNFPPLSNCYFTIPHALKLEDMGDAIAIVVAHYNNLIAVLTLLLAFSSFTNYYYINAKVSSNAQDVIEKEVHKQLTELTANILNNETVVNQLKDAVSESVRDIGSRVNEIPIVRDMQEQITNIEARLDNLEESDVGGR